MSRLAKFSWVKSVDLVPFVNLQLRMIVYLVFGFDIASDPMNPCALSRDAKKNRNQPHIRNQNRCLVQFDPMDHEED